MKTIQFVLYDYRMGVEGRGVMGRGTIGHEI